MFEFMTTVTLLLSDCFVLQCLFCIIPLSHYRQYHPRRPAFGDTSLSLDHCLASVCKLVSHWPTVLIATRPTVVLKCLKFLPLILEPLACTCTDKLLATITDGVVHDVWCMQGCASVVLWCNLRRVEATVSQCRIRTSDGSWRTGAFHPTPITVGHTACRVHATRNLRRYVASLELVPPPRKTFNCGMYHL